MEVPDLGDKLIYIYPVTAVIGTLIQQTHLLQFLKSWYFIQPKNFINKIFAGNAYIFVGIILLSVTILLIADIYNNHVLPINNEDLEQKESVNKLLTKRALKFLACYIDLNLFLNYDLGIFNLITKRTASCSIKSIMDSNTCAANEGVWYKGFDSSGHLFLLTTVSLLVINELQKISPFDSHKYHQLSLNKLNQFTIYIGLALLLIWYELFVITSVFYHTIFEKIVGFSVGFGVTLLINKL